MKQVNNAVEGAGTAGSPDVLDVLEGLIRCPSENPPGREEEAAHFIATVLQENGIPAEVIPVVPGRPNVVARLKGQSAGKTLLFNGHLDTVPGGAGWSGDPFGPVRREGKLYGRGASDMKSGVAAMACAAIRLKRMGCPFPGELVLFFNCDEEATNIGMKWFLNSGITMDYAVIGEPTSLDICTGHRGVGRYRLQTFGVAGHTCFVRNPENAIYRMLPFVQSLKELGQSLRQRSHEFLGSALLTVSQITGGTAPNVVPDSCLIEIDRRTVPGETRESVLDELRERVESVSQSTDVRYALENYLFLPATHLDHDHPLVEVMRRSIEEVRSGNAQVKAFEATCEAPFFSVDLGVPTLIVGPGSLAQAHVTDEFVFENEVPAAVDIYVNFVQRLLGEVSGR